MARRRKITAPSAKDLEGIEDEFRRETLNRPGATAAPISQIASEIAHAQPVGSSEDRAKQALDLRDAKRHRAAVEQGRMIEPIGLDAINEVALVRDRMILDPLEMAELKASIMAYGLRLPIEVYATDGDKPFGLISGFRRLFAVRELSVSTGDPKFETINAIVRDPDTLGGAITAMVEENEIRASLSHFERGRIAVIAAQQGMFASSDAAVDKLFNAGSKAKRSKIRSFALIFEELGDMLAFPESLREKDGLRIAAALRAGAEARFREALSRQPASSFAEELAQLEAVITAFDGGAEPSRKGGRPSKIPRVAAKPSHKTLQLPSGVSLQWGADGHGHLIRLDGDAMDADMLMRAVDAVKNALTGA
ncbi:MAG: ParB/RepB/Spo0J family partition protein [Litoreibacter sp.]